MTARTNKVTVSARIAEFACHEKSCAPPPAGKGGSSPSAGHTWQRGDTFRDEKGPGKITRVNDDGTVDVYRDMFMRIDKGVNPSSIKAKPKSARPTRETEGKKDWHYIPKGRGSDDGYDALKDAGYNSRYHRLRD